LASRLDSSVWIDYARGSITAQTEKPDQLLAANFRILINEA
jgi:hypothetical protein